MGSVWSGQEPESEFESGKGASSLSKLINLKGESAPSNEPQTIFIAGGQARDAIEELVEEEFKVVGGAALMDQVVEGVEAFTPDVIVINRYLPGSVTLAEVIPQVRKAAPNSRIVLLIGDDDPEGRRFVGIGAQCGVYNVLVGELTAEDLMQALREDRKWQSIAAYLPENFEGVDDRPRPQPFLASPAMSAPVQETRVETRFSMMIACVSGKAGVGKSSIASNLLVAGSHVGAVGIDMDYDKADLAGKFFPEDRPGLDLRDLLNILNLEGKDIDNISLTREDAAKIAAWVDRLPEACPGVTVVPGPARKVSIADVPVAVCDEIIAYAARKGRIIVVDTAFDITHEAVMHVLEQADEILVFTTPFHAAIYEAGWYIAKLRTAKIPIRKVKLVVNMVGRKGGKPAKEISDMLGVPIAFVVKDDPVRMEAAALSRKPIALRDKSGPWNAYINYMLAGSHAETEDEEPASGGSKKKSGLFGRLRGGR